MAGGGLLELERDHIRAVIRNRGATDVPNTAKQQQQYQHLYKDVEFHGLCKEHILHPYRI
jgi:hypothetical protein